MRIDKQLHLNLNGNPASFFELTGLFSRSIVQIFDLPELVAQLVESQSNKGLETTGLTVCGLRVATHS